MSHRPRIAISLGDPCGIGPELLLATLGALCRWAEVVVVGAKAGVDLLERGVPGTPKVAWRWAPPEVDAPFSAGAALHAIRTGPEADGPLQGEAHWIDPTPELGVSDLTLGQASAAGGRAAVEAVRCAARLVMEGGADALVTLPLSKHAAHLAGYSIPGHTEFLQQLAGAPLTRMAFVSPTLSVVLHTVHQSLRSVVEELDAEAVAETLTFAADRFMQLTGRLDLRVALCALNPHAGESGAFGDEEGLLEEALTLAEASFMDFTGAAGPYAHLASPFAPGPVPPGWALYPSLHSAPRDLELLHPGEPVPPPPMRPCPRFAGPLPADTLFLRASRGEFDLVVALYHDQGLIPLKVLEPARAVNLTLGLPFIRTSPDHGTAFDRAGRWSADPTNFLEAASLAVRLAERARRPPGSGR